MSLAAGNIQLAVSTIDDVRLRVRRRSGWFVSGNQDGDPDALGWMIVAPDCR
jgi:hypothetical protein